MGSSSFLFLPLNKLEGFLDTNIILTTEEGKYWLREGKEESDKLRVGKEAEGFKVFYDYIILLKANMVVHSGYPEVYIPLIDKIDQVFYGFIDEDQENYRIESFIKQYKLNLDEGQHENQEETTNEESKIQKSSSENNDSIVVIKTENKFKYKGFINMGNTCYMNSFLQALFLSTEFRKCLINDIAIPFPSMISKTSSKLMIEQLSRLFCQLAYSQRPSIKPVALKAVLPKFFQNYEQHDWSEFAKIFLDKIEEEVKGLKKE